MASIRGWLFIGLFRLTRRKHIFLDTTKFERSIENSQRTTSAKPPSSLRRHHHVEESEVRGFPCVTLRPRTGAGRKHVLYLHGGAYVHSIEPEHWRFLGRLVDALGCTVTAPLYPLAPRHRWDETTAVVEETYDEHLAGTDPQDQVIMGDSAGGALTLVLARTLRDEGRPQPGNLVLLSPWLDITMTDPAVPILDRRDPYLSTPGLLEAGRIYAGDLDPTDPRVSPLYGDLKGLGRISVFAGTRDVLLIDSRHLRRKAELEGVQLDYFEYQDMFHAWVLQGIPEAYRATRQIVDVVRGDQGSGADVSPLRNGG